MRRSGRQFGAVGGRGGRRRVSRASNGYVGRILAPGPRCREKRSKEEKGGSETECMYMGIRPDAGPAQPYTAMTVMVWYACGAVESAPPLLSHNFWEWPVSQCYGRNKKTQAECLRGLGAARQAHPKAWMVRVVVGCQPESSAIGRAQIGKTKARF